MHSKFQSKLCLFSFLALAFCFYFDSGHAFELVRISTNPEFLRLWCECNDSTTAAPIDGESILLELNCDSVYASVSYDISSSIQIHTTAEISGGSGIVSASAQDVITVWRLDAGPDEIAAVNYVATANKNSNLSYVDVQVICCTYYDEVFDSYSGYKWSDSFHLCEDCTTLTESIAPHPMFNGEYLIVKCNISSQASSADSSYSNWANIDLDIQSTDGTEYLPKANFVYDYYCEDLGISAQFIEMSDIHQYSLIHECFWDLDMGRTYDGCGAPWISIPIPPYYCSYWYYPVEEGCSQDYIVSLTVNNGWGIDTHEEIIHSVKRPNVRFTYEVPNPEDPSIIQFYATSDCPADLWLWDFGDGYTSDISNPIHMFVLNEGVCSGDFIVKLTGYSQYCSDSYSYGEVLHIEALSDIEFIFSRADEIPFSPYVQFDPIVPDAVVNVKWFFNDGSESSEWNPSHIFPDGCTQEFQVKLEATDINGCISQITKPVYVEPRVNCTSPRVLIVNAIATIDKESHIYADETISAAKTHFEGRGWTTIETNDNPSIETIKWALVDPCIRGLYIISHAVEYFGSDHILLYDEGSNRNYPYTPAQVAEYREGQHLEFVTVIACMQDNLGSDWADALTATSDQVTLPSKLLFHTEPGNYLAGVYTEKYAAVEGHGTRILPCSQPLDAQINDILQQRIMTNYLQLPDTICPSFMLCDSLKCGNDLYPVYSCARDKSVPLNGIITIYDPENMFEVAAQYTSSSQDSVWLAATYFQKIPEVFIHSENVAIGRFLLFENGEDDTLVNLDGITITLRYSNDDLTNAGIFDERSLGIYYITNDGAGLTYMDAVLNTTDNSITFTAPQWGIAGIYEFPGATSTEPLSIPSAAVALYQNHPNPFNPSTKISYSLPTECNVILEIFDISGKLVKTLINGKESAGIQSIEWDGCDAVNKQVTSGIYFYRLTAGKEKIAKKMVLLR